ncbi:C-terminal helicase domain-containing protein [Micromonospora viridifaciens]|uniref:C-terminal helicase domain-containing protein n=1 Tax=Micromonospora viridifaciens TaxID=1881 RepID=UPI001E3DEB05|nr:helicase-related protein [Micromonospora viridifaciens]
MDDDGLCELAEEARQAIASRPSTYVAFDPHHPGQPIKLPGRFALRYGGRGEEQSQVDRKAAVRRAFNSPFWPFVVATTSAGQEGIDFHQWCSAVVHWNTPANPVDFEQREGRVHRFGGHAVRRNVAAAHRAEALRSSEPDVWKAVYDAARATSGELGDFAPYWVFPGPAKIERHVLPYPLSRDQARLDRLKADLAVYRLAFGQPRQEDLLNLLRRQEPGHVGVADIRRRSRVPACSLPLATEAGQHRRGVRHRPSRQGGSVAPSIRASGPRPAARCTTRHPESPSRTTRRHRCRDGRRRRRRSACC